MFNLAEGARWLGLLPTLGVLIALLVWYAVRRSDRAREVVTAWGAVSFVVTAAGSVGVAYFVGLMAGSPSGRGLYGGDGARNVLSIVLALVGVGVGLFVMLSDEPAAADEPAEDVSPVEPAPRTVSARTAVAAVVAMALPITSATGLSALARLQQNGWSEAALVVGGLAVGAGVLFVVLVADVAWAPVAFLLVAVGIGLTRAYPEVFFEQFWFLFASGLSAGLLLPAGLRLLNGRNVDDRGSLVRGVLLGLLVFALLAGLGAKGSYSGF